VTKGGGIYPYLRAAAIFFAAVLILALGLAFGVIWLGAGFLIAPVIVLSLLTAVFLVAILYSVFFGAPFLPTDRRNVEEMLRLAGVRPGDTVYDLGCGDGRILVAAAKAGAAAEGWEINPLLWLIARINARRAGLAGRIKVHLGDYWFERFDQVDVVTLFLITSQMSRMERKLRSELRPGSRVASYVFKFPTWPLKAKSGSGVYLYVQETKPEGSVSDS